MKPPERFLIILSVALMVPFAVLNLRGIDDLGALVGSYTVVYLALRFILNPRLRVRVDVLGLVLVVASAYFIFGALNL